MKKAITILSILIGFQSFSQTTVNLHSIEGYGENAQMAEEAASLLERVINSEKFKEKVLSGKYIKTNGLTNQELYDAIMQAHEKQGPGGTDGVIDLRVRTLRIDSDESNWSKNCEIGSRAGTIGIDGTGDGVTAICPQRLDLWATENNLASLAGHYAHEYMHILGFNHFRLISWDSWRQKTFVYKIGNLVEELAIEMLKNN